MTSEVKEETAEPVETMEDYAAELEASYKTLNKRNIEIAEEESGVGAKVGAVRSDDGGAGPCSGKDRRGGQGRRCDIPGRRARLSRLPSCPPSMWRSWRTGRASTST